MNKEVGVLALAAAVVVVGVLNYVKEPVSVDVVSQDGSVRVVEREVGAAVGPEHYNHQVFRAGYTRGGRVVSTSTAAASTLVAGDLMTSRGEYTTRLEVTPSAGAVNITLPASSTLTNYAPSNGDTVSFIFENEATAATNTTIVAGTGMDLQEPDGQNVVIGQNNYAIVTLQRDENNDFVVWIDETIPAD